MLQTLHVRDLALIPEAEVVFAPGLNVLSGETGGGKSLLVTALKLLRGGRAAAGLVRHGADELRVDAEFVLGGGERSEAVARVLAESCGLELDAEDQGPLLVTRIVDGAGRSKVRINHRPSTLTALRELGSWLLEIHGQDDSRALMRPEIQAETLDAFAGCAPLRQDFAGALRRARRGRARLEEARGDERDRLARIEFLRYQLREMEETALQPGELEQLERDAGLMAHLDRLRERLQVALASLQDGEPDAAGLLARARRALEDAAEFDPELRAAAEAVAEAEVHVADAGRAAQSGLGRLDRDPRRLAEVEERLDAVRRALRRFGPGEEEWRHNLQATRAELGRLEDPEQGLEALETAFRAEREALLAAARKLQRARARAAPRFCASVERELRDLSMARTKVRVATADRLDADALLEAGTAHGPAPLDFEVRINQGEPFHSLRETASGGEMARLVLAMKKCLADRDRVPFLVFDEIDAEIGGRLGLAIGAKLGEVARHHQVLIVTHLPQVAAFAHAHFAVRKREHEGRTLSEIVRLGGGEVERELAAMAVGEGADRAAIAEARRLVAMARERDAAG